VFATNSLSCLPDVDYIIVLKDGSIQESGTYEYLKNSHGEFAELLADFIGDEEEDANGSTVRRGKFLCSELHYELSHLVYPVSLTATLH
jgi:hypothetical protein